jgi:hypothetical protein
MYEGVAFVKQGVYTKLRHWNKTFISLNGRKEVKVMEVKRISYLFCLSGQGYETGEAVCRWIPEGRVRNSALNS